LNFYSLQFAGIGHLGALGLATIPVLPRAGLPVILRARHSPTQPIAIAKVSQPQETVTSRTSRRLWFIGLWLMLPFSLPFLDGSLVPAVRYVILASASIAIAFLEGSAGPVGMLIALFAVWGAITTSICWGIAWAVARGLSAATPSLRAGVTWGCLLVGLIVALGLRPYSTPFGRAATGGLLEVLS
jgi:hypothetical protein